MFKAIHVVKHFGIKTFTRPTVIVSSINKSFCNQANQDDDCIVKIKEPLDFNELKFDSKVPIKPHVSPINLVKIDRIKIDGETIELLERLSLVNVDSKEAIQTLEDSIEFASKILHIDTTNIEPLYTVLEDQNLSLREDLINDGNCRDEILSNAKVTEEEYFVAPPGNIPLEQSESIEQRFDIRDE